MISNQDCLLLPLLRLLKVVAEATNKLRYDAYEPPKLQNNDYAIDSNSYNGGKFNNNT